MKIAIMQPYFFPYIGYFQLLNAVDEFIIYDNIEYTKKGWINRNRILANGKDQVIGIPIKKDSDYLTIIERTLSDNWEKDRNKLFNKIKESYRNAPYYKDAAEVIEECLFLEDRNLFRFILNSLECVSSYLNIETPIITSSNIPVNHDLKSPDKVLAMSSNRGGSTYINPIGGVDLYKKNDFLSQKIKLRFLKTKPFIYAQHNNEFVPWLSIIDIMMFCSKEQIGLYLNEGYSLIEN